MKAIKEYPLLFKDIVDKNERYEQAWIKAKDAAQVLKIKYHAKKVILFGSLINKESFDINSDIDLAVLNIPDNKFYDAVGTIMEITSPFDVDIVDINECRKSIKNSIKNEGIEL